MDIKKIYIALILCQITSLVYSMDAQRSFESPQFTPTELAAIKIINQGLNTISDEPNNNIIAQLILTHPIFAHTAYTIHALLSSNYQLAQEVHQHQQQARGHENLCLEHERLLQDYLSLQRDNKFTQDVNFELNQSYDQEIERNAILRQRIENYKVQMQKLVAQIHELNNVEKTMLKDRINTRKHEPTGKNEL